MFDKLSHAAERLATRGSRRELLGQLGRGALALTGVLAGVLAFSGRGQANASAHICCYYGNPACPYWLCVRGPCPSTFQGQALISWSFAGGGCHTCAVGCF